MVVVEVVVGEVRVAVGLIVVTVELGATVTVTMLRIALEQSALLMATSTAPGRVR